MAGYDQLEACGASLKDPTAEMKILKILMVRTEKRDIRANNLGFGDRDTKKLHAGTNGPSLLHGAVACGMRRQMNECQWSDASSTNTF